MKHVSLRLPDDIYDQLKTKGKDMGGLSISDVVRIFLQSSLENPQNTFIKNNHSVLQKWSSSYGLMTYCLMEKFLTNAVKNGQSLADEAHEKAEQLINNLLKEKNIEE